MEKNWVTASIATGIAIPVALFSAAFLSPNQGVQATSDDKGYSYPEVAVEANWAPDVAKILPDAFKDGELYDATVNGHSSVTVTGDQMKIIEAAGMKLTLKDNRWELAPASDRNKVDFNTVLQGIGFPTAAIAAVNGGATDGQDIQTIISFVQSHGIQTMNGGVTSSTNSGVQNTLLSGSGFDMGRSRNVSATTNPIGSTKYSSIVSGPLNKLGTDNGSPVGNTLIADGGTLQGTNSLPNSLVDACSRFDFTDGSFAQAMRSLRNAVEKINSYLTTVSSPASVQVKDQYDQGLGHFDFSKATQDSNGDYVFVLNSDTFSPAGMLRVDFSHQEAYKGGNVILLVTGDRSLNFNGQADTFSTNSSFIKNGHLFLAIPNGNEISFGNSGTDKTNEVNLLAPTSTIDSNEVGANGLVGVINGQANPSAPIDGGGNGYFKPGDGTDTLTPTDDHTQTTPAGDPKQTTPPTDTNTTPEGGSNTTTPQTPKSKTITVNQKITTSVSNDGKINPSDIPVGDLPTNTQTKSTRFTATVKDDGTVSYTNADGSISPNAPFDDVPVETTTTIHGTTYTVQVKGVLEDGSDHHEDTLDTKAVTDQISQAADGTTLNWNIAVVYFPSSTSKSGSMTVTDHVDYQFDLDDTDSDESLLPDDFDRTATLTYTQKTDSQGNKSYSDWVVASGLKPFEVPILKGYKVELEDGTTNNAPLTDAALLNMVENAPDPLAMTDTYTDIVYTPIPQIEQNKPDNHKQDDGPRVKTQVPTDDAPHTTGENLHKRDTLHQLDNGVQVKTQVPTGNTPHTVDHSLYQTDDGMHVYTQVQVPDDAPHTTGENLHKRDTLHQLDDGPKAKTSVPTGNTPHTVDHSLYETDDGVHVYTQVQVPDDAPHTTGENLHKRDTLHQLDDGVHVYTKAQVPEKAPSVTPDDGTPTTTPGANDDTPTTTTPGGNDGTPTTTTPGGNDGTPTTTTPGGNDGTPTTTTPGGNDGTPTTTTPSGNDGTPTPTTPGGDDGTPTTTTPSGDDGTPTTTTPGGDDGTPTTTTPGGNDGTPTTTTPGGNDGTPTTTTPGGNDGTPTTTPGGNDGTPTTTPGGNDGTPTTTPSGNDGTPTTTTPGGNDGTPTTNTDTTNTPATDGGLTTTNNTTTPTVSQTPTSTGTPTSTTASTTPTRTGNGLTGQTPTTDTTTTNSDGTTSRTLRYVDATKAPAKAAAAASDNAQPVTATKPNAIPDQTAIIADQTNAPSPDEPAESAPVVANVIDENAILTHGNIFTAGGAPGMADYTFFSQPVMDTTTNSIDHYELLLRVWDSKQGGWHLPASFSIPASMEAHLMARAVAQLDVKDISINLTDTQFEDPDTQKAITNLAQSDAVDNLTIELATIPDNDQLEANAKVFQKAGVTVTLDNLGSHTDGTQLAKAADHVDTLKVSLRGMRRDGNSLTQMRNQLAAWQQAATTHHDSVEVEGVESAEELAMTQALGITALQGYYFSRPAMPGTRADLM